jgi:DnaJ family protein C protein 28
MGIFERIAEDKILAAFETGEFSQLKGKGQPINFDKDPFVDEDWELAYHILKNNHLKPDWIELNQHIERVINDINSRFNSIFRHCRNNSEVTFASVLFTIEVKALNKKIFDYNLLVPIIQLQRRLLSLNDELAKMVQITNTYSDGD